VTRSNAAAWEEESTMKTRAAVCWEVGPGARWEVSELDLDPPREREVLIRWVAAGLCHSDEHILNGDLPCRVPLIGGHEGAGIVEEVGPGVTRVSPGDHVVCSFLPVCGTCRFCATGQSNLCDLGATLMEGSLPNGGGFRYHARGEDIGAFCMLGSFSERGVVSEYSVVKIDDDLPLERAVLVGCGVPTGWGSSVYAAKVGPGDTVVIYGIGGIGINAVQGARHAGAANIVAVDPLPNKRAMADELGATHSTATGEEAHGLVLGLTNGVGADRSIVTVGVVDEVVVEQAFNVVRKGGSVTIVGLGPLAKKTIQLSGTMLTLFQKTVQGTLFGSSNPMYDIRRMLELYRTGQVRLDELCTATYSLEDVNQGYQDLRDGRNIRGVIVHG
jgi:alcohol dehydrogenase (nicotinoprotein)